MQKLLDLKWNFAAEDMISIFGQTFPQFNKSENYRIINSTFFDEENNSLKTRHIKWLDLISLTSKETIGFDSILTLRNLLLLTEFLQLQMQPYKQVNIIIPTPQISTLSEYRRFLFYFWGCIEGRRNLSVKN